MSRFLVLVMVLSLVGMAAGAEGDHANPGAVTKHEEARGRPAIPSDPRWARTLVTVIFGLFIAAIPIGIIVRMNVPEETAAASDDEQSGRGG
jgi:hypothetical protein